GNVEARRHPELLENRVGDFHERAIAVVEADMTGALQRTLTVKSGIHVVQRHKVEDAARGLKRGPEPRTAREGVEHENEIARSDARNLSRADQKAPDKPSVTAAWHRKRRAQSVSAAFDG